MKVKDLGKIIECTLSMTEKYKSTHESSYIYTLNVFEFMLLKILMLMKYTVCGIVLIAVSCHKSCADVDKSSFLHI